MTPKQALKAIDLDGAVIFAGGAIRDEHRPVVYLRGTRIQLDLLLEAIASMVQQDDHDPAV